MEGAQIVVLAAPYDAVEGIVAETGGALADKILADATNRRNVQNPAAATDGTSNAEGIQARVRDARVVRAYCTAFAAPLADPATRRWTACRWTASSPATARTPRRPSSSWCARSASAPSMRAGWG